MPRVGTGTFRAGGRFVLGAGSSYGKVIFPPAKVVSGLARIVRERGGLVMANEITTGMGPHRQMVRGMSTTA